MRLDESGRNGLRLRRFAGQSTHCGAREARRVSAFRALDPIHSSHGRGARTLRAPLSRPLRHRPAHRGRDSKRRHAPKPQARADSDGFRTVAFSRAHHRLISHGPRGVRLRRPHSERPARRRNTRRRHRHLGRCQAVRLSGIPGPRRRS